MNNISELREMAMEVKCYLRRCAFCKDDLCTLGEIEIDENGCETFISYVESAPEYREVFYKHLKSNKDGHLCKRECHGKKIERFGLTFYTNDDDRFEPERVGLTEEITGYYCGTLDKLTEERCNKIREKIKTIEPVKNVPDAVLEDW